MMVVGDEAPYLAPILQSMLLDAQLSPKHESISGISLGGGEESVALEANAEEDDGPHGKVGVGHIAGVAIC